MSLLVLCILREGQWDWGIDQHLQGIVRVGIIYARVWLCTRVILYFRPHDPIFFSCPLLSNKTPTLFLHQAYLTLPFILVRSTLQKETSAQWENALIIHDHLTIQDLVCVAYVVFLISVCQPHL